MVVQVVCALTLRMWQLNFIVCCHSKKHVDRDPANHLLSSQIQASSFMKQHETDYTKGGKGGEGTCMALLSPP
jgi:hypothetical protein